MVHSKKNNPAHPSSTAVEKHQGMTRIVLVDDHQVVRNGTKEMLLQDPTFEVVGELANGNELIPFLKLKQPDILLLDIHMPGENGLQLLEKIRPQFPSLKILLFSAFSELAYLKKAQILKADGYLSKTIAQSELHTLIHQAMSTQTAIYSSDLSELLQASNQKEHLLLTPREQEILTEVAKGITNAAIASKLCVSVKTVDTHVANLMKKLGVNRRTQLATLAIEQGLI